MYLGNGRDVTVANPCKGIVSMVPYMASKSLTPLWSIVVALYVYTVCAYREYTEFRHGIPGALFV